MRASVTASIATLAALALIAGCGNRARDSKPPPRDARTRRVVIEPSTDRVGPLPPYAIRADGVGPYKLGDKLSDLLERLASGPRIALFEIPSVVHSNVIHAEDDEILIGGEQSSTASFVAVVTSEVARTEAGIHVGSTREDVVASLGPPSEDPERARDPRLYASTTAPNLRAVLAGDRVAAIVVSTAAAVARHTAGCQRPAATDKMVGACLTSAGELVHIGDDEVVVHSADGERALGLPLRLPGLVFAAPLRNAAEARDELVAVTRSDDATSRTWSLSAYRLDGARLVRAIEATPIYQLTSANARWIGADLRDVDLYLELTSQPDAIEVGGLLTTLGDARATKIRDVVVISPALVRRRGKPAAVEAGDAGVPSSASSGHVISDAATDAADPAGGEPSTPGR